MDEWMNGWMNEWIHDSLRGGEHHKENEMRYNYWITKSLPGVIASSSFYSVQFSSVAQSCPTLRNPMNRSTPGLPVHHQLLEFTQTHVHQVGDIIQPSHSLSLPSPPASNPSQHQGLFQWVNSSCEVAKVLEFSFSISPSNEHPGLISFRMNWLDLLAVQGTLSRVFSNTTVQSINSLALSFLHSPTLTSIHDRWKNHSPD